MSTNNQSAVPVTISVSAGLTIANQNKTAVPVKTKVRTGGLMLSNQNKTAVPVKTKLRSGGLMLSNHNQSVVCF